MDYKVYTLSKAEKLRFYIVCPAILFSVGYLFYRDPIPAAALCLIAIPGEKLMRKYLCDRRRKILLSDFRDALYTLSGALAAGKQLPEALEEARDASVFSNGSGDLALELDRICNAYRESHARVDLMLEDFGRRSGLEDIQNFAVSCSVCMRCGGDLEAVSLRTAGLLLDRMGFQRELEALIAQKKTDIAILTSMPVLVLLFLNLTSAEYIRPLYETLAGRGIMTACLCLIAAALYWSCRIIDIEV